MNGAVTALSPLTCSLTHGRLKLQYSHGGSAAEERINYYVVSAANAIPKDERSGIGLVRD